MWNTAATATLATLAVLVAASCGPASRPQGGAGARAELSWSPVVEPLVMPTVANRTPAVTDSAQPHLSRSRNGVILSWLEQDGPTATLRFAERTAGGWSEPRTVASGDDWFVSWADVPSVIQLSDGTLVAHWYTNTDPRREAYDLWLSYSTDSGLRWSPPFMPHDDGTTTQHGFATLFEPPGGGLGLVWLDGRAMELDQSSPDGGAMSMRFASYDTDWARTADHEIDGRVCECCTTSVTVTEDGLLVAYRDRSLREVRDIHVSRLENGAWTYGRPVALDNWRISACPVNGPAMTSRAQRVAVAWFTAVDDRPQARAAFSDDGGRSWDEPIRLDDEASLGHVAIELLDDGSAVASWVELADGRSRLHVRRIESSGGRSPAVAITSPGDGPVSGYPRMVRAGNELLFAWTESTGEGRQQLRGAVARLP